MEPRVMISINFFLDPAVAALTDFQKITFLQCIIASKRMRSAGKFKSVEHLKAVLDSARARAIPALLKEDLLVVGEDDVVTIRNYSRYQVDLTSNARQEKFRARKRAVDKSAPDEGQGNVDSMSTQSRLNVDSMSTSSRQSGAARNRGGITDRTEREQELNITPISPLKRDGKSRLLPISEILGAKRNA